MDRDVRLRRAAQRNIPQLPQTVQDALYLLILEIEKGGPVRGNWPKYIKLSRSNVHHCHLAKGKPKYVAIWEEDKKTKII